MSPSKTAICLVAGAALAVATSIVCAPAAISTRATVAHPATAMTVETTGSTRSELSSETRPMRARSRTLTTEARGGASLVFASTDASCSRVRRKLWVEGEGWIVRRIAVCR